MRFSKMLKWIEKVWDLMNIFVPNSNFFKRKSPCKSAFQNKLFADVFPNPKGYSVPSGPWNRPIPSPPQSLFQNESKCEIFVKALANEDTLLRTQCCRHKCFSVCPRAQHLLRTQTQKMCLILFRNILCPQQMFPSLRNMETQHSFSFVSRCAFARPRNIMRNNVSATMCPCLPGP